MVDGVGVYLEVESTRERNHFKEWMIATSLEREVRPTGVDSSVLVTFLFPIVEF